jgi:hypothetical protein
MELNFKVEGLLRVEEAYSPINLLKNATLN